jgi:WD40 repeat protein
MPGASTVDPRFIAFSSDSRLLLAYDGVSTVYVLSSASLGKIRELSLSLPPPRRNVAVLDIKTAANAPVLAVLTVSELQGGKLAVFNFETGNLLYEWKLPAIEYPYRNAVALSDDGSRIAVTSSMGHEVFLMDQISKSPRIIRTGYGPGAVAFGSGGQVITASNESDPKRAVSDTLKVWDFETGKLIREIPNAPEGVHFVLDLTADKQFLLGYVGREKYNRWSHGNDLVYQRFRVWNTETWDAVHTTPDILPKEIDPPCAAISPDGNHVVVFWRHGETEFVKLFSVAIGDLKE